jgi:putative phosphoesterase
MTGRAAWSFFLQHPDFHCVQGNMDDWDLAADLPARLDLELGGLRVAACHGWGFKAGLSRRIYDAFGPDYDIIFFGHTHVPEDSRYGRTRCVNPGSLRQGSLALVTLDGGRIDIEFVTLSFS